jgi:hypothetical protein
LSFPHNSQAQLFVFVDILHYINADSKKNKKKKAEDDGKGIRQEIQLAILAMSKAPTYTTSHKAVLLVMSHKKQELTIA